uniref:Bm10601 n=1 Tax=Elaeophora elaphi TaxID=1147741 RepID=A0A0R3RQT5_9BILA
MAVQSTSVEQHQGIVTYCDDRLARIWIEAMKCEKKISFAYRSRHFNLGDWLSVSLTTDDVHKITPPLETRVLKIGVAQVRTEVIFGRYNEKIGHGTIIQSKHFGRVAVFAPFTGIIVDRIYRVYVERIPEDRRWNEQESGTYWFVPSNQKPKLVPITKYPANDTQLIGPLTGVVVSRAIKFTFVWTPVLGEGICENHENLVIGRWIKFTADKVYSSSHLINHVHMNINFRIIEWTMADPILRCVPLSNNLMLISTASIPYWPMNNLIVDWIGPVTDRDHVLEKAISSSGVGQTYEIMLKRSKKSLKEPVTTWNVYQVLNCINRARRNGIVCFVDIQKSFADVYTQDISRENGRMLQVDLKIFEAVPALGDWFNFEIDECNQFWRVLSATKTVQLCTSRIFNGQLQVETEVVLTDKISTKGHRVMFSVVLGAVADFGNRLSNIISDVAQKYTVWCTTTQAIVSDDPYWRITNFHTLLVESRALTARPNLNMNTENFNVSYVGIVVSECKTGYFVWTSSLADIICYQKSGLHIGDWIRFWIRRKRGEYPNGKPFCVNNWEKIDSPYRAREENKSAVVTVELMVPENYGSQQPPPLPFFGEVFDRKHYFGAHISDIRGHKVEVDIKRFRTKRSVSNWEIIFVLLKRPLHKQEESVHAKPVEMNVDPGKIGAVAIPLNAPAISVSTQNAAIFSTGAKSLPVSKSVVGECSYCSDFEQTEKYHSPTTYDGKEKEYNNNPCKSDSQKDSSELDPVICSMKLLLMSKEVRRAIKMNCAEEYTVLLQYFDLVP